MNKKHAYLIIAHHQFELLELLCRCLDHPLHDIYIHLDAKVPQFDYDGFRTKIRFSNVLFIPERVNVVWGGFSQIRSELALFREATKGEYEYYHMISGVDLPLRSAQEIYEFFHGNSGKEFIHFSSAEYCNSSKTLDRIRYYHLLQEYVGNKKSLLSFAEKAFVGIQRLLRVNRLSRDNNTIKCGTNWVSITHSLAKYILDNEKQIEKLFGCSFCADELFVQTLVWNSPYRNQLYHSGEDGAYAGCARYVDWNRGGPYTFCSSDFEELTTCQGYMFARKFDYSKDPALCQKLARWVLDRQQTDPADSSQIL